ncbi:MAG TPA: sulfite exporter TauE/SafE family protein [Candidatus Hydrogenedentes bacterium]|nr:sulfite exporter TauE/SafE family protein [Candidatus Hydrogenedentota bacterium]
MLGVSIFLGGLVGTALALTGGGGAMLAVPLLVYGVGVDPAGAVLVSLTTVGITALAGALHRIRLGQVDLLAGLVFAVGGIFGAPLGTWIGARLPESVLLGLFAVLIAIAAWKMWVSARTAKSGMDLTESDCARKGFSSRCAVLLSGFGIATGILAGLFGVGGGFIIVPVLVTATGMGIHRAASTSLMVIAVVSGSALVAALAQGRMIAWDVAAPFAIGGLAGLAIGTQLARSISGPMLQRGFAAVMGIVATMLLIDTAIQ